MCGSSAPQEIIPGHGPFVSSPSGSDSDLPIHSSCPRCHHYINKEVLRLPKNFQRQGVEVKCSNCGNRIMLLGRESTHSSFASQETTHPVVERTDSSGTGELQGGPAFPRNIRHSLAVSTTWSADHIPGTVLEVNSAAPHDDNSVHSGSLPGDGNPNATCTVEGLGQGPRDNNTLLDFVPTATSARPSPTIRPTSGQVEAEDVPIAGQGTLRPADLQGNRSSSPRRPGLLSKLRIRAKTQRFISAFSRRASHRFSRFRAHITNAHPASPRSRSTNGSETAHNTGHSIRAESQQQTTEDLGQTGPGRVDGTYEDTYGASLGSVRQATAPGGGEGGDIPVTRSIKEMELAERRRQLTVEASICKCECAAARQYALISRDIDRDLQGGSRSSTPGPVGRGRSMSRHGGFRWLSQRIGNSSPGSFFQRGPRLSGITIAPSVEAPSSNGARTGNSSIADDNDSTHAQGR
ncbi:hypothetical protein FGG08_003617 [Glutinoglossum americanum]|uniref:Uncharacterized protein n=1 Tax=Glutinoglossum americanum TaxID=1670608 RepID=A0A9P8I2D4_9PEZI|nr:hypothetical protein FGG08_003617 [Glutinoglossum americanum]